MRVAALALILVSACAPPDDLPASLRDPAQTDAPFPPLEPLAPLLARARDPRGVDARTAASLSAAGRALRDRVRASQTATEASPPPATRETGDLRRRADALRAPVVDDALRARLASGPGDAALQ